jgi:hypothetical protein
LKIFISTQLAFGFSPTMTTMTNNSNNGSQTLPMQSGPTSIEEEICLVMVKMEEEKRQ